jgi:hypothetical protein
VLLICVTCLAVGFVLGYGLRSYDPAAPLRPRNAAERDCFRELEDLAVEENRLREERGEDDPEYLRVHEQRTKAIERVKQELRDERR